MANAIKWITNVGKSVSYSLIDELKASNPTLSSFKDDNGDTIKSIYNTIKMTDIKGIANNLSENKYFKLGQETLQNLKEDLKTGKLYNKERESEYDDRMMDTFMGDSFSDMDFGFDDDDGDIGDFDFGDDDDDVVKAISSTSKKSNEIADLVGEKTSKAISSTIIATSEYVVEGQRRSTKALFDQNNALFGRLHADMGTINSNLSKFIEFNQESTITHYNQSATFYQNMESKIDETNSILKEMLELQKNYYNPPKQQRDRKANRYSDIVGSGGLPNIQAYMDLIKDKVKSNDMLDMLNMFMDMGMGNMISASPGKVLTDAIAKKIIPNAIKKASESFNETLSGVFANIVLGMNKYKDDEFSLKGILSNLFGLNTSVKKTLDTSIYKKDAIPFDGVTKKAITEVIPTYLSKILAAVSNNKETRYDYENGKFIALDRLKDEFNSINETNIRAATSDMRQAMMEMSSKIQFDKNERGNYITRDQFEKDLAAFFAYQYNNAKVFNGRADDINPETYGMKGGKKSQISADLIKRMWNRLPRHIKTQLAGNILNQRDSQTRRMLNEEESGNGLFINIFNDSENAFTKDVDSLGSITAENVEKYQETTVSLLTDIRKELSYIRTYGLPSVGGRTSSTGIVGSNGRQLRVEFSRFKNEYNKELNKKVSEPNLDNGLFRENSDIIKRLDNETNTEYAERIEKEFKVNQYDEDEGKKAGLMSRLIGKITRKDAAKTIAKNIDTIVNKPVEFLSTVITKADESVYKLIFGSKERKEVGILQVMKNGIRRNLNKFGEWLDEKFFNPLSKKLTKENLKKMANNLFSIFGLDFDRIMKNTREFLFGEKVDGKRTKKGIFGEFIDNVKNVFKDAFGWVKNAFTGVFERLGIFRRKNKRGEYKSQKGKEYKAERGRLQDIIDQLNPTEDIPQAAIGIKRVPKTGIYALSEGEAVIPPDYNPANIRERYRNEKAAINKYKKYGGINMLAEGSDPDMIDYNSDAFKKLSKEDQDYIRSLQDKGISLKQRLKDVESRIRVAKLNKKDYEGEEDSFGEKVTQEAEKLLGFVKTLFGDIKTKANGVIDEASVKKELNFKLKDLLSDVKEAAPEMTVGGIIGGGTSLLTGMIGGPILGAAVGAGVGLLTRSKTVQNLLFGEWDEKKQSYDDKGILGKNLSNNLRKYVPSMAKGATVGAITSVMPFVPGGPVAGIIVGSAVGFASRNEEIMDRLFGEQSKLHGLPEYVKKSLPRAALGGALGALAGPFGIGTNILLGSAIGFASDTNKFKDIFFGEVDEETGNRTGGVYGTIVDTITGPLKEFVQENMTWFSKWFQETVKDNLTDFFQPLKRRIFSLGEGIMNFFKEQVHDNIVTPIADRVKSIFSTIFRPLGTLFRMARGAAGGIIGLPLNMLGGIGRAWKRSDIRRGKANYMSVDERLQYRRDNSMGFRPDRAYEVDQAIYNLKGNQKELNKTAELLEAYDRGRLGNIAYINKNTKALNRTFGKNYKSMSKDGRKELQRLVKAGDFNSAVGLVSNLNMDENERSALLNALNTSGRKIARAKKMQKSFETGEAKGYVYDVLREKGIDLNKISYRDALKLINKERDILGKNPEQVQILKEEQMHTDTISKMDDIINILKKLHGDLTGESFLSEDDVRTPEEALNDDLKAEAEYSEVSGLQDEGKEKANKLNRKELNKKGRKKYFETLWKDIDLGGKISKSKESIFKKYLAFQHFVKGQDFSMLDDEPTTTDEVEKEKKDAVQTVQEKAQEAIDDVKSTVEESILYYNNQNEEVKESKKDIPIYNFTDDGTPMKYYKDSKGDIHIDKSDSETVTALANIEEEKRTQVGILDSIKAVPSKIISFFGGNKDDDKKNENLFSKILKIAGMGIVATALAPYAVEFAKNTLYPLLEKAVDKLKDVVIEFKDGFMKGFFGESTPEGGLIDNFSEKVGEGARYITDFFTSEGQFLNNGLQELITDKVLPNLLYGIEEISGLVIPKLAEAVVTNIPGIISGLLKGISGLFGSLKDLLIGKKPTEEAYEVKTNIKSIKTNTGKVTGFTPSSAWNVSNTTMTVTNGGGNYSENTMGVKVEDADTASYTGGVTATSGSTPTTNPNADAINNLAAKAKTATNKYAKVQDQIAENYNDIITITDENGQEKQYTLGELLNNDKDIVATVVDGYTGEEIGITGSEILNYPKVAEKFGLNTYLTRDELEQQAEELGYDHGDTLFSPTSTDVGDRVFSYLKNSLMTGSNPLNKLGNNKVVNWFSKLPGLASVPGKFVKGYSKVVGGLAKPITYLSNALLPESLIGKDRKAAGNNTLLGKLINKFSNAQKNKGLISSAAQKLNNTKAGKIFTNFVNKVKTGIIDLFGNSKVAGAVKKLFKGIGDANNSVDDILKKMGKELAERISNALLKKGHTMLASAATKVAGFVGSGGILAIANAVVSFISGMYNAGNIAGILDEDVTPILRLATGATNAINDTFALGIIDSSTIFNLVVDVINWLPGIDDLFDLEVLQDKANSAVEEKSRETGAEVTIEDINNEGKFIPKVVDTVTGLAGKAWSGIKSLFTFGRKNPETTEDLVEQGALVPVEGSYAAGTTRVDKSGLYALSEGETVISPDDDSYSGLLGFPYKIISKFVSQFESKFGNIEKESSKAIDTLDKQMAYTDKLIEDDKVDKNTYSKINNSYKYSDTIFGKMARAMNNVYKAAMMPLSLSSRMISNMNSMSSNLSTQTVPTTTTTTSTLSTNYDTIHTEENEEATTAMNGTMEKAIQKYIDRGYKGSKTYVMGDGTIMTFTDNDVKQYEEAKKKKEATGSGSGLPDTSNDPGSTSLNIYSTNIKDATLKPLSNTITKSLSNKYTPLETNFVSQKDNTTRFNISGDSTRQTVSDSGCAPAVATMVINSLRGKNAITLQSAANDALNYKVPNSGVTSTYFDNEFNRYGIQTQYIDNNGRLTNNPLISNIKKGVPTILLGQDSSNRNSKSTSPFGPNPHYVATDGLSKDNKYIYINDPEQKTPKLRYLIKDIIPKVKVGIAAFLGNGKSINKKLYIGGAKQQVAPVSGDYIGKNTKQFESGDNGPLSIVHCGDDGGLSYGSYQMTWKHSAQTFWNKYYAPKYGTPSNYNELKTMWEKAVAEVGVDEFFATEWDFILSEYYKPVVAALNGTFNPDNYSRAMQDCLWSWAVHRGAGTAAKEFKEAAALVGGDPMNADEVELINACYDVRGSHMTGSSASIATGRYGTGAASERAVILSLVGQNPITYTSPSGALTTTPMVGSDGLNLDEGTTTKTTTILDELLNPFVKLAAKWGLTTTTSSSSSSSGNSTGGSDSVLYTDGTISGQASSDPNIAKQQAAVVSKMYSILGQNLYGQDNAKYPITRDPDQGGGDCSSTVQWAYQKTVGVDVGSWSGGQTTSPNTYVVDEGYLKSKPNEANLQLADILLYGNNGGSHAELYFGNGQVITHGDTTPGAKGPQIKALDRRNDYWVAKRLNQFKSSGTSMYTGSGSGINGSFVSQLDPRYANNRFNIRNDSTIQTIGDTGCAPASAAMVLSDVFGRGSMMDNASKLALNYKQPNSGVSADYFSDIYSRNGLSANYYGNSNGVMSDLNKGKDVVLLGQDSSNRSKSNSPFGPNPHYVVASGLSKNGKSMTIKDPESNKPKRYSTDKILKSTKLGIGYGTGLIRKGLNKLKRFIGGATVLPGNSNREKIWNYLISKGCTEQVAAGIIGNLMQESSCDPTSKQYGGGPGRGIAQWTEGSDRWNGLVSLASSMGVDWTDLYAQCEWMWQEIQTESTWISKLSSKGGLSAFLALTDIEQATKIFCEDFERAGVAAMSNRIKYAKEAYQEFTGKSAPVTGATTTTTGTNNQTTTASGFIDSIMKVGDLLANAYGLTTETVTTNTSGSTGSTTATGPGSSFPTYTLTDSQFNDVATAITGETGGTDLFAAKQEASQMANLNEVTYGRQPNGSDLYNTLHGGWYASASWTRGVTDIAKQAVQEVLVEGKRTLPRYVTEHDTFPMDIKNAKNRSDYKFGDPVSNVYGSNYKFYDFFGKNKDGDISGYFDKDYAAYQSDTPWGSGSGLGTTSKSGMSNTMYANKSNTSSLSNIITSAVNSTVSASTDTKSSGNVETLIKTVIKLLAEIVNNTGDLKGIVELLSRLVELQGSTTESMDDTKRREIQNLRSRLSKTLSSYNVSQSGANKLSSLMESIENLAME